MSRIPTEKCQSNRQPKQNSNALLRTRERLLERQKSANRNSLLARLNIPHNENVF